MRKLLGSPILLAVAAGPASACINDADTDESEREFQKRYETEPTETEPFAPPYAAAAGVLLLLAGAGIVRKRIRP